MWESQRPDEFDRRPLARAIGLVVAFRPMGSVSSWVSLGHIITALICGTSLSPCSVKHVLTQPRRCLGGIRIALHRGSGRWIVLFSSWSADSRREEMKRDPQSD